ncbi:MAG: serine/threonine-protein kinase, partial [Gemmataceae bacterium]
MNETRPQRPAPNPPQTTDTSMPDDQVTNLDSELKSALYPPVADGDLGQLGHYRLVRVLGQGGMGMVFEGEDPKLGRAVAIKVMQPSLARKPGMKERFFREARAAAVLEHDNIVPIFHLDEQGGVPFLVMPFLRGVTLEDWLRRHGGSAPVATALRLAADIAAGLAAAHEKGLVHRDVKPANIWLDASAGDRARLLDFGLARLSEGGDQLTQPGALVGTPSYMAPEQARGDAVDARADLFSLGVVLYRLCAGRLPFAGNDPMSVLIALAMEDPVTPRSANPAVPEGLSALVMRLLEKDPARRPVTARAVLEELGRLRLEEERAPTPALPQPPVTRALPPPLPPRRRRWPLVAAAVAGALGLLAAAVVWLQTPHGAVRIEVNDPGIEVTIDKGAANIQGAGKEPIRLAAGPHGLAVKRGDLEFETKAFTVRKGETVTLKVELRPGKVQVVQGDTVLGERDLPAKPRFPPLKPGWLERVGDLSAKSRAEAVEEELRRRHPGVHPIYPEPPEVKEGQVARLVVGKLSDLTPLAALPELQELKIDDPSALDDLAPLRGLKLVN